MPDNPPGELDLFLDFLAEGREEAGELVDQLEELPESEWDAWLNAHPEARSFHAFHFLLDDAEEEARHGSADALALTAFVTRHAGSVTAPPVAKLAVPHLGGRAWTTHANLLRSAGRLDEALQAYQTAAAIYRAVPVMAEDLAEVESAAAALRADVENFLTQLSRDIVSLVARVPADALRIAEVAIATADALSPADYSPATVARLRARAWKDRALPLRDLARYPEAIEALDRAEKLLDPFPSLAQERTIMRFARMSILQYAGRYDEAADLLVECKAEFAQQGDEQRQLLCSIAEGSLLYRVGRWSEARTVWHALLAVVRESEHPEALANIQNNLGHVLTALGDFRAADDHLREAVRLFKELDRPLDVARSELARGRMMIGQGQLEEGIAHLRRVRAQFLRQNVIEEAGLCGLDIVEAQLSRGAPEEAEALARQVIREFTAGGLSSRAITALHSLSEAIAARRASIATVDNVRQFIRALHTDPEAEFRAIA